MDHPLRVELGRGIDVAAPSSVDHQLHQGSPAAKMNPARQSIAPGAMFCSAFCIGMDAAAACPSTGRASDRWHNFQLAERIPEKQISRLYYYTLESS
jgi:hypothetical protein